MTQKRDTSAMVVGWIVVVGLALAIVVTTWHGVARGEYWSAAGKLVAELFALMLWLGFTLSSSRRPSGVRANTGLERHPPTVPPEPTSTPRGRPNPPT